MASDEITVGGHPVGYMYHQDPDNQSDSGWRFLSGRESQAFADDPDNFSIYDVNSIANYDSSIAELLEAPFGSAYARDERGKSHPEPFPDESDA